MRVPPLNYRPIDSFLSANSASTETLLLQFHRVKQNRSIKFNEPCIHFDHSQLCFIGFAFDGFPICHALVIILLH